MTESHTVRITVRITEADERYTDETTVGVSNNIIHMLYRFSYGFVEGMGSQEHLVFDDHLKYSTPFKKVADTTKLCQMTISCYLIDSK